MKGAIPPTPKNVGFLALTIMSKKTALGGMFVKASADINNNKWLSQNRLMDNVAIEFDSDNFHLLAIDSKSIFGDQKEIIKLFIFKMNYEDYEKEHEFIEVTFEENLHYLFDTLESTTPESIKLEPHFFDDITCINDDVKSDDAYTVYINWLEEKKKRELI